MDKIERRQALLHAARDVFATKGYHDTKVDDIVARANVAKGTFYLYFPDKRSVFSELVDLAFLRLGAAILQVDPAAEVDAQVKHNIRAIIAVLLDDPALTRILISYSTGMDPAFVVKMRSFYDGVKTMLAESLAEGQRLGIVADGDPRLLATFTVGALKELLSERAEGDGAPLAREPVVASVFAFLEAGYLRTKGPTAASAAGPAAARRSSRTTKKR
jgi:AcrR family transcriptional regulator